MAEHSIWEVRYLLTRIEGVLTHAASGWSPWLGDDLRKDLASAADDLERAAGLLDAAEIAVPEGLIHRARGWGLLGWRLSSTRRQLLLDRDELLRLEGQVTQYLKAHGIHEDRPSKLGAAESRRDRATNRRGRGASVTAAG